MHRMGGGERSHPSVSLEGEGGPARSASDPLLLFLFKPETQPASSFFFFCSFQASLPPFPSPHPLFVSHPPPFLPFPPPQHHTAAWRTGRVPSTGRWRRAIIPPLLQSRLLLFNQIIGKGNLLDFLFFVACFVPPTRTPAPSLSSALPHRFPLPPPPLPHVLSANALCKKGKGGDTGMDFPPPLSTRVVG